MCIRCGVWSCRRDRGRLETRCLPARISTTGHCIMCHDTKPHDRARSKQHACTRHAKACHATVWLRLPSLARHCRNNSTTEQGGDAPISFGHVHTFDKVQRPFAAQLCNRSAKRGCNQLIASIAYRRKYHKVNKTITKIVLQYNKIGDAGAVALAESLKAMFVTCVLQVRSALFSFCHLSRNSVSVLFCVTHSC